MFELRKYVSSIYFFQKLEPILIFGLTNVSSCCQSITRNNVLITC